MREITVMRNFQGYFSRTFQDLRLQFPQLSRTKVIFQDFTGAGTLKKKIQDFPGGVGTLNTWSDLNFAKAVEIWTDSDNWIEYPSIRDKNRE